MTEKPAHTPGPWTVSEARTVDGTFMVVGGEGFGFGLIADVVNEADARRWEPGASLRNQARSAIALATGEGQ